MGKAQKGTLILRGVGWIIWLMPELVIFLVLCSLKQRLQLKEDVAHHQASAATKLTLEFL